MGLICFCFPTFLIFYFEAEDFSIWIKDKFESDRWIINDKW